MTHIGVVRFSLVNSGKVRLVIVVIKKPFKIDAKFRRNKHMGVFTNLILKNLPLSIEID